MLHVIDSEAGVTSLIKDTPVNRELLLRHKAEAGTDGLLGLEDAPHYDMSLPRGGPYLEFARRNWPATEELVDLLETAEVWNDSYSYSEDLTGYFIIHLEW